MAEGVGAGGDVVVAVVGMERIEPGCNVVDTAGVVEERLVSQGDVLLARGEKTERALADCEVIVARGELGHHAGAESGVAATGVGVVEESSAGGDVVTTVVEDAAGGGEARCRDGEERERGGDRHRRGASSALRGGAAQGRDCERTLGTQAGLGRHVDLRRVRRAEPSLPWSIRNPWHTSDGLRASLSPGGRLVKAMELLLAVCRPLLLSRESRSEAGIGAHVRNVADGLDTKGRIERPRGVRWACQTAVDPW